MNHHKFLFSLCFLAAMTSNLPASLNMCYPQTPRSLWSFKMNVIFLAELSSIKASSNDAYHDSNSIIGCSLRTTLIRSTWDIGLDGEFNLNLGYGYGGSSVLRLIDKSAFDMGITGGYYFHKSETELYFINSRDTKAGMLFTINIGNIPWGYEAPFRINFGPAYIKRNQSIYNDTENINKQFSIIGINASMQISFWIFPAFGYFKEIETNREIYFFGFVN